MTQYNTLNVKLSNSQLSKLKSGIKNSTEVILNLSSNVIGNSNDEASFPHKYLLTNTKISRLCKAFPNNSLANIKLYKTQWNKIRISEGFLDELLGPLLKTGLPLMKNVLKPLAKSVLIPLGLTAAASATDSAIQKKIHESGATILIISNKEIRLLIKGVSEKSINEKKERKGEFLGMLLDTLGAVLLVNLLASLVTGTNKNEDEELLKKEESTEILKILGLLINIETYEEI